MYYYLRGTLFLPNSLAGDNVSACAVIDCGGVGYKVMVSLNTYRKISLKEGQEVKLYTYFAVREDAMELYGFYEESELAMYRSLISVSGVGPKAALGILSTLSCEALVRAITTGDTKAISAAPGIGKKIAERVILELKDKLGAPEAFTGGEESSAGAIPAAESGTLNDAMNALAALGYSRSEAAAALRGVQVTGRSLDDVVRDALRNLFKG